MQGAQTGGRQTLGMPGICRVVIYNPSIILSVPSSMPGQRKTSWLVTPYIWRGSKTPVLALIRSFVMKMLM